MIIQDGDNTAQWKKKFITAKQAANVIQAGERIFIGIACATPRHLVSALEALIAIIHKQLKITKPLYTSLQVLSIALFEKIPLDQAFGVEAKHIVDLQPSNQLNLFSF